MPWHTADVWKDDSKQAEEESSSDVPELEKVYSVFSSHLHLLR